MDDKDLHLSGQTASESGSDQLHLAGSNGIMRLATISEDNESRVIAALRVLSVRPASIIDITTDASGNAAITLDASTGIKTITVKDATVVKAAEQINRSIRNGDKILSR